MRILRCLFCLLVLSMVVPTLSMAQTASGHFPNEEVACPAAGDGNVPLGAAGEMGLTVVAKGIGNIKTNNLPSVDRIGLSSCDTGAVVATKSANSICKAAVTGNPPLNCAGTIDFVTPCTGLGCCATTSAQAVGYVCRAGLLSTGQGFAATRAAGNDGVLISIAPGSIPASEVQNLNNSGSVGNAVTLDILPQYLVGIDTNGVGGNITVKVTHGQGGANPRSFTLNAANYSENYATAGESQGDLTSNNQTALANDLASGFAGLGLGLTTTVHSASQAAAHSRVPETFTGPFVRISNINSALVTHISVDGATGHAVTVETGTPITAADIPTLSEWGMALLVGILMLSALWLMRRRRLQQA